MRFSSIFTVLWQTRPQKRRHKWIKRGDTAIALHTKGRKKRDESGGVSVNYPLHPQLQKDTFRIFNQLLRFNLGAQSRMMCSRLQIWVEQEKKTQRVPHSTENTMSGTRKQNEETAKSGQMWSGKWRVIVEFSLAGQEETHSAWGGHWNTEK